MIGKSIRLFLVEGTPHGLISADYAFKSPSAAVAVIYAGNQNGRLAWKHKQTGHTYKDWQESRLKAAGVEEEAADWSVAGSTSQGVEEVA